MAANCDEADKGNLAYSRLVRSHQSSKVMTHYLLLVFGHLCT